MVTVCDHPNEQLNIWMETDGYRIGGPILTNHPGTY